MKYTLEYVGDYHEATPREMMLQNIQEMVYLKYDEGMTFKQMVAKLNAWSCQRGGEEIQEAVDEFVAYNREQNSHLLDENESLVVCEGKGCLQFDLRPVRNDKAQS